MKLILFTCLFIYSNIAFSKPKELMNGWEIQRYKYKESGVYDLKFDIEIEAKPSNLAIQKSMETSKTFLILCIGTWEIRLILWSMALTANGMSLDLP